MQSAAGYESHCVFKIMSHLLSPPRFGSRGTQERETESRDCGQKRGKKTEG